MNDEKKTKNELIQELKHLRRQISLLNTRINTREELLVRALPVMFYSADMSAPFTGTWVSDQVERITGFSPSQFNETPDFWLSRIHPDDKDRVLKEFETNLTKGPVITEYRWLAARGYIWMLDHAVLALNARGQPTRVVGMWLDITERKEAEEKRSNEFAAEALLSEISTEFVNVNSDAFEVPIRTALRRIGEFAKTDYAFFVPFSEKQYRIKEGVEWVKAGNQPLGNSYAEQSLTMFPWIMDRFIYRKPVEVSTIHQLPEGAIREREYCTAHGIKSFLIVPIFVDKQLFGAIGVVTRDYSRIWFEYHHRVLQVVGEIFAATLARKESEDKLRTANQELSALFQSSPLAIIGLDREAKVTLWSQGAERMFGWSESEVKHQMSPTIPFEKREQFATLYRRALEGEIFVGLETLRQKKDGTLFPVTVSAAPVSDSNGNIIGIMGIVEDISKRKQAEKALQESEERYRALAESAQDFIFIVDKDGYVQYVNPSSANEFAAQPEDLVGKNFRELFPPDRTEQQLQSIRRVYESGDSLNIEHTNVFPKRTLWLSTILVPLRDRAGKIEAVLGISRDISTLKEAEEALRQSEERYRLLVENATEGIFVAQDGRIHFVNPAVEEVSGYSREELISRPFTDFIHPDDREMVFSRHRDRLNGGSVPVAYPFRIVRKDAEIRWVRIGVTTITWNHRPATLNILGDITHQRQTEKELEKYRHHLENLIEERTSKLEASKEALSRSDQRYREIIEVAQEGVWMTDVSGRTSYINHRMAVMLGHSSAEILSRPVSDFMAPESSSLWDQFFRRCTAGIKDRYDFRLRTREGKDIWVMVSSAPRHDEEGRFNGTLLMVTDISEQKEAVEKIVTSKKMLQRVFDGISEPLIMMDKNFAVRMLNQTAKDYYRMETFGQIIGKPLIQDFLESDEAGRQVRAAVIEGRVLAYERRHPSDPNRFERVITYPLQGNEGILGDAIIRISDITEARLLQREIIQNEKLASLGLLISSIAHEINNPANFISFNIPVLGDYLQEMLPILDDYATQHPDHELLGMNYREFREDIFRLLGNIEHGTTRINTVVSNLREFSRKKDQEAWQRVPLSEVVEKAVAICAGELKKKVKSVDIKVSEDLPRVFTDPGAVEQILVNLLINAIQAMEKEDSWIRVRVQLDPSSTHYVQIEVSDNGYGMDKSVLDRIFEPFFTTKPPGTGTGLGLYVSQNLILELGGNISVESQPGMGSTFTIQIPVKKAGEQAAADSTS